MSYTPVSDTPLASTLLAMTAASVDRCDLSERELMIARIAALAAVGASSESYAFNAKVAALSGITVDDARDILVAVAPIIGTAHTVSAVEALAEGLELALALEVLLDEAEE
jgi:alkylhydroperoxidase/carboxymuconolactone decarboxylase family protein YurZ